MSQLPEYGPGDDYGQYKLPSRGRRPPAANMAGTQRRTTDPKAYIHHHPRPAPPSNGPTAPQTYAAPMNSHPESPRQPGPSSTGRAPTHPVAATPGFSKENTDPAFHPAGNYPASQFPQKDVRPARPSNSWGTSTSSHHMATPLAASSTDVGIPTQYGVLARPSLSPAANLGFGSTTQGSSSYSPTDSSDESSGMSVRAPLNHRADPEVHRKYRSVRLQAELKDPVGQLSDSTVEVRREKRVVLELFLHSNDGSINEWGWQGIRLPPTGSVKAAQPRLQEGLLHLSVLAYGSSTGTVLSRPCENCWLREWRALGYPSIQPYIVDFKADNPVTVLSKSPDSLKVEVTFHFKCYTSHQQEEYELGVELRDESHLLVAHCRLPYRFSSVPKRTNVRSMDDLQSQPMPDQRDSNRPLQEPHPGPPIPTSPAVSRPEPYPRRYSALLQRSHPQYMRQYAQHDTNNSSAVLERLAPSEGPLPGGIRVLLSGVNFPPPPECIYARFGTLVTQTFWHNPYTLGCLLPASPHPGLVPVSLSLYHHPEGPPFGQSNCWFQYTSDRECVCAFLYAMSTQDRSTSLDASSHLSPGQPSHSPDGCALIQHMAQSQRHLAPISDDEMENVAFRSLASLVGSSCWRDMISFTNNHNQTLAHLAVLFEYTALLEKLVEWGVNLDVQDLNGFTALHCAYLCKDWECVRLLRCAGADEDLEDNLGRLPVDIYSPTGYIRSGTPSSDGTSSPARIPSEDEDWENVTSDVLQPSSLEVIRVVKNQPGYWAHTSDSHSKSNPLILEPSSAGSNDSWIKAFEEKVQIPDPSIDLTPSPGRQVSQLPRVGQYTTRYTPATSLSTGQFHPHESTREPATAYLPTPGTPTSDLTSSLSLSDAGPPFPRVMNHRGESASDLSSVYPGSLYTSPTSTPSPMPPETPLHMSWSNHILQMHRPDSSASHHYNMLHHFDTRLPRLHLPSPTPSRTGVRYDPPPHPPPSYQRFGALPPYLDEKSQKDAADERKTLTGSSHLPPSPFPPSAHEYGYAHTQQLSLDKSMKPSKKDHIRERETIHTQGNNSRISAAKEKEQLAHQFTEQASSPVDGHGRAKGQVNVQQRGRHQA